MSQPSQLPDDEYPGEPHDPEPAVEANPRRVLVSRKIALYLCLVGLMPDLLDVEDQFLFTALTKDPDIIEYQNGRLNHVPRSPYGHGVEKGRRYLRLNKPSGDPLIDRYSGVTFEVKSRLHGPSTVACVIVDAGSTSASIGHEVAIPERYFTNDLFTRVG